jgi:hypothetical protein
VIDSTYFYIPASGRLEYDDFLLLEVGSTVFSGCPQTAVLAAEPRGEVLRAGFVLLEQAEGLVELGDERTAEEYLSVGLAC